MIPALFCNLCNRCISGNQQFTGQFHTAFDHIIHTGCMKIFLINGMQISGTDIQFLCHIRDGPFTGRVPVDFLPERNQPIIHFRKSLSMLYSLNKNNIICSFYFFAFAQPFASNKEGNYEIME